MNRRTFLAATGCAATGMLAAGSAGRAMAQEGAAGPAVAARRKARIGVLCPAHCAIPLVYADLAGIYRKHGLETEIVYMPGMSQIVKGVASGDLQAGHIIAAVFLAAHLGVGPFKTMQMPWVTTQVTGTNGGVFAIARGRGIRAVADLKGRTIGAHNPLMTHSILVKALLAKHGLKLGVNVTVKTVDFHEIVTEMKKGNIDAFIHPEPLPSMAATKGVASDFMLTKDLWYRHPCCVLGMTRSFFEKEKETAHLLTLGTMEAGLAANDYRSRDRVIDLVHAKSQPYGKLPRDLYRKAFMPGRTDFEPFPYQSSAKVLLDLMKTQGMLPGNADSAVIARETFLSDYARKILSELEADNIPESGRREETILGEKVA